MDYLKIAVLIFFFTLSVYFLGEGLVTFFTQNAKKSPRLIVKMIIGLVLLAGSYYYYSHYVR